MRGPDAPSSGQQPDVQAWIPPRLPHQREQTAQRGGVGEVGDSVLVHAVKPVPDPHAARIFGLLALCPCVYVGTVDARYSIGGSADRFN